MEVKAKELRTRTSSIIKAVKSGEEVTITYRGKRVAVIKPLLGKRKTFNPVGFGLWSGREDLKDVERWIREKRAARYGK